MKAFTVKDLVANLTSEFGTPTALPYSGLHFVVNGAYGIAVYPKQSRAMATFTVASTGAIKQLADVSSERPKFGDVDYFKKYNPEVNFEEWSKAIISELKTA